MILIDSYLLNKIEIHDSILIYINEYVESLSRNVIFTHSRSTFLQNVCQLYREQGNFRVEKAGRHQLDQVVKVNITVMGQSCPTQQDAIGERHSIISVTFLHEMLHLNLIMRKHQTESKVRDHLTKQRACNLQECPQS